MDVLSFSSGAYVSSFLTPIFELGEIGDLGRRTGMAMSITALGALAGPPISGAINKLRVGLRSWGIMQVRVSLHVVWSFTYGQKKQVVPSCSR